MSQAWHTAGLIRWNKRLPKLDTLLLKEGGSRQTWQEQLLIAHQWVARGGGRIRKKGSA